ncbi:MAG: hypothetical protein Q8L48_19735 [Archangium sp.]|nr:hypothetical protein [Archangium sp.]
MAPIPRVDARSPAALSPDARLDGKLRQQAVVENLLEAVMKDHSGCDTWELGTRTRLPGDQWVVPVRLTNIKEEGWLGPKKTAVEVRFAVVDGEGRVRSTHAQHPVAGATAAFPDNGHNSWTFRGQ